MSDGESHVLLLEILYGICDVYIVPVTCTCMPKIKYISDSYSPTTVNLLTYSMYFYHNSVIVCFILVIDLYCSCSGQCLLLVKD